MTKRYEIVRSSGDPPLMLIFLEGNWDSLPFEVRLLCPWYEGGFCGSSRLTARQRSDIAVAGYSIAIAAKVRPLPRHAPGVRISDMQRRA